MVQGIDAALGGDETDFASHGLFEVGEVAADPLAEIEAWLREHEPAASGPPTAEGRR